MPGPGSGCRTDPARRPGDEVAAGAAVYLGFDPTASSLHLGNLVALAALLHFSLAGHPAIALVGGATGRVGDPSWRATAKDTLAAAVVDGHAGALKAQLGGLFRTAAEHIARLRAVELAPIRIVDNLEWYQTMGLLRFLGDVGSRVRVAAMLGRDSVRMRAAAEAGLSYAELSYQLLQAYDFQHLRREHGCRLQLGGSDQWGNIVSGIDLIHRADPADRVDGLTVPLFVTGRGEKMGKSAGNAKWLCRTRTLPFDIYQYFCDMPDGDACALLPMLSFRRLPELQQALEAHRRAPEQRLAQRMLGYDVVALVHSEADARQAERASELLFDAAPVDAAALRGLAAVLADSPLVQDCAPASSLVDVLHKPGLSRNSTRALIRQGGVSLNGSRVASLHHRLGPADFLDGLCLVKSGKQAFVLLRCAA